ncbi:MULTISPECIES: ABC transporter permease [unclassified Achromobacter]|uniref:ABC transporter permease n=1 Tax=unclassified Achromobacter TaxID=2626865 RepID=UPI000B514D77|nr:MULTISPECIES: ABC transporter permease [unclassified Achromobacter]OWT68154.1 ABC transporter permease [Achromobacter sp. HZ34]OWT69991.1 ABC transporter permease [Achromobacter sp. HZ28]
MAAVITAEAEAGRRNAGGAASEAGRWSAAGVAPPDAGATAQRSVAPAPVPALVDPRTQAPRAADAALVPRVLQRLLGPLALIAVWQALTSFEVFDPRTTPAPLTVLRTAADLASSGALADNLTASLLLVIKGLALGISIGLGAALSSGLSRAGENIVDANMEILRAVPNFALLPILIAWFGIDDLSKVLLITLHVAVCIYINTYSAIRSVDSTLIEAARCLGVKRAELIAAVILPGALPGFLVGLRLALTGAWLSLIFAETINAPVGLGRMMSDAREYFRVDVIFVLLAIYALLGLLSLAAVRFLESRLLAWRRSYDGE